MTRREVVQRLAALTALAATRAWPVGAAAYAQAPGAATNGQASAVDQQASAKQVMDTMMVNEEAAAKIKDRYRYLSNERSERTGGRLWTEKVVETPTAKVRFLLAEDGQPLSPERMARERGRLAAIVANPAAFERHELAQKNDEAHMRQMLTSLPQGFLLGNLREEGGYLRIEYTPNPAFEPRTLEERVLHGMSGFLLVDQSAMRLHHAEGRLASDVSIGFGLLATIRAGSSFSTTRELCGDPAKPEWKTTHIDTDIDGKAIFFKVIARKEHAEHIEFVRVPNDLTIVQAVEIAEQ